MSKTLLRHTLIQNIFDIFADTYTISLQIIFNIPFYRIFFKVQKKKEQKTPKETLLTTFESQISFFITTVIWKQW